MNGRILVRIILSLVLVALLAGLGGYVYNLGIAQGLASSGRLAAPAAGNPAFPAPYAYGPFWFHPWGFGIGIFGFLFPFLGFLLIFSLIRWLLFPHRHGFYRGRGWGEVPPEVEEWHRRMHEKSGGQPPSGSQ